MTNLKKLIDEKYKIIIISFFIIFFILGMAVLDDYGISWDEQPQRELGQNTLNLILNADQTIYSQENIYHGTAFTTRSDCN